MGKLVLPTISVCEPSASDIAIGICIPVFNQVANDRLAATVFTLQQGCDLPYQLSLGIGPNCVAKNRLKALARLDAGINYVLMCDDDILAPPHFASKMVALLRNNPDIGAVSAVMVGDRGQAQNNLYPGNVGPTELVDSLLPGTFFMYDRKRTPLEWDERYLGSQWEDTDAMMQIKAKGLRTVGTGNVQIMHRNAMTGGGVKYWEENRNLFISKWGKEALL